MDWSQIVLIVFIGLLVIAYPILVSTRNKKENQKLQEQTNSLKRGDKVLTTSGVYGTVVDLQMESDKKIVTIETGSGNRKSYMAFDAYAIYTVFRDEDKKQEQKSDKEKADNEKSNNEKSEKSDKENADKNAAQPNAENAENKQNLAENASKTAKNGEKIEKIEKIDQNVQEKATKKDKKKKG